MAWSGQKQVTRAKTSGTHVKEPCTHPTVCKRNNQRGATMTTKLSVPPTSPQIRLYLGKIGQDAVRLLLGPPS